MSNYKILSTKPVTEYQGNIYAQKIEIQFNQKVKWIEDDKMLVSENMDFLPDNIKPIAHYDYLYENKIDIPSDKKSFTLLGKIKTINLILIDGFEYFVIKKFEKEDIGKNYWMSVYFFNIEVFQK